MEVLYGGAMFDFLKKKKAQTIVFDESYCHSNGTEIAEVYKLAKDVTDLTFDFGSFENFLKVYVRENPYFPQDAVEALNKDEAVFLMQVVQDEGLYTLTEGGLSEHMLLSRDTLVSMGAKKKFKIFKDGVIAIGIYHLGQFRFQVLWSTVYESEK